MNLIVRTFFAALMAVALLVLPWDVAVADPDRGRGRQDPPGHSRQSEDPDDGSEQSGSQENEDSEDSEDTHDRDADDNDASSDEDSASEDAGNGSAGSSHDESAGGSDRGRSDPDAPQDQPETAAVTLDVSATPEQIEAGETSTINVTVAVAEGTIEHAEILVDLPQHLRFRSASLPASTNAGPLRFELGPLSDAVTLSIVVEGVPAASATPVRVALSADGTVLRDEIAIRVGDESEGALALSQNSPLLVQVGDSGSFSLTLRNGSDQVVEDAVVVAEIAPELDVVGVAPVAGADAIQLGRSPSREDIVWTFDELDPGEELQLTWSARAVVAGDLEATMSAQASAADAPTTSTTQTTYLGFVRGVRTDAGDDASAPVAVERVVTKLVPVTRAVSGSAAAVLPLTGATPGTVLFIALALIALGAGAILLTGRRSRRGISVALLAMVLTASACVSDPDTNQSAEPPTETTTAPETEPEDDTTGEDADEKEDDRVLGLRIDRDRRNGGGAEAAEDTDEVPAEDVPATEVVLQEVTTIERVLVPAKQSPAETLASRPGDNQVSIALAGGAPTVTSSRIISAGATEEILVSAGGDPEQLTATASVRNLADRPLIVRGTLVLEIVSSSGASSELTSDAVDVMLQPGGETSAEFSFSLPPGVYGLTTAFRAY